MSKDVSPAVLGTQDVSWNLTAFYAAPDDAAVGVDLATLKGLLAAFEVDFKGKLDVRLGDALDAYTIIVKLMVKLQAYFDLSLARDTTNVLLRKEASKVQEAMAQGQGKHLTFFDLEIARLDESALQAQIQAGDERVLKHLPMIQHIRKLGEHHLEEAVETSLTLRAPFGPSEWSDMMSELESGLRFELDGKVMNLPEILHIMGEDRDGERRAAALAVLNEGLDVQKQTYFMARTLNVVAGNNLADNDARGFTHAMQATNLNNQVDDATVEALHDVVRTRGAELARRFYQMKTRLLKMDTLRWSDRNAPMPFAPEGRVDWAEACRIVIAAYTEFSPTLGALVEKVLDPNNGWVDAPPSETKISGAFDYTTVTPEGARSYMLLNYLGSNDDVMTLAHELGHAVHGLLGAEAQGALMWHAPTVYAETASIFGEMLTFESLLRVTDDKRVRLSMFMDKMMHFLNTVVRQICFSEFEQALYAKRREGKLSIEDIDGLWLDATARFYGEDGDVFTYGDTSHLWSYVSHFHAYRPFYVYAYAFGELFTQSLMATRGTVGDQFEPLYLDLLRAGGTKDAVGLMAPFGLNPNEASFWRNGLESSFGHWLSEAERLVEELGL